MLRGIGSTLVALAGLAGSFSCTDPTQPGETAAPVPFRVDIAPTEATLSSLGDTTRFIATVRDSFGNQITSHVTWTVPSASVVAVDSTGLVTAVANGTITVIASAGAAKSSVPVKVQQVPVTLRMGPISWTFASIGETVQFRDSVLDARGRLVAGAKATWETANQAAVTVSASGLATSVANGTSTIRARFGEWTAATPVGVDQRPAATALNLTVPVGAQFEPATALKDAKGVLVTGSVWSSSSDATIVSLSAGTATANKIGSATLTGTLGTTPVTASITVSPSLSADIGVDLTLTRSGSPYRVSAFLAVAKANRLKIMPGVSVLFNPGTNFFTRYTIRVQGILEAIGTATDSIHFSSGAATPGPADWGELNLNFDSPGAKLDADNNYVSGSAIAYADFGYCTRVTLGGGPAYFTNNRVHHCGTVGTDESQGSVAVGGFPMSIVRDNIVEDNVHSGISVSASGAAIISRNIVRRNSSNSAGGIGVYSSAKPSVVIEDNRIVENTGFYGAAIFASGGTSPTIRYNEISRNIVGAGGELIGLSDGGSPTLSYNNIENNSCGGGGTCRTFAFGYSGAPGGTTTIDHNNIVNPAMAFELFTKVSYGDAILAGSNFWNTASDAVLAPRVSLESSVKQRTYLPLLNSRVTSAGPRVP